MNEVQKNYLKWAAFNDYEIEEIEEEIKKGEEPLVFEDNQFYSWESGYNKAKEELSKRIAELEKENAELKVDYEVLSCSVGDFEKLQDKLEAEQRVNNVLSDNLSKAKEIINEFMRISKASDDDFEHDYSELIGEAEQFLKEVS